MLRQLRLAFPVLTAVLLSACGGGGGTAGMTPSAPLAPVPPTLTSLPAPTTYSFTEVPSPQAPQGGLAVFNGAVYLSGTTEFMRYTGAFATFAYALPQGASQVTPASGPGSLALGPNSTIWNIQTAGYNPSGSSGVIGVLDTVNASVTATPEQSSAPSSDFFGSIASGPNATMWLGHTSFNGGFVGGWADVYNASMQVTAQYPPACNAAPCPNVVKGPYGAMVLGSDGDMYLAAEPGAVSGAGDTPHPSSIARVDPVTDTLLGDTVLPAGSAVRQLALGPDGAIWFTDSGLNEIGRITSSGAVTYYPVPTASAQLAGITPGSDNAMWFAETGANKIGRISMAGQITEYAIPDANAHPVGVGAGPLGGCVPQTIYFTESTGLGKLSFGS